MNHHHLTERLAQFHQFIHRRGNARYNHQKIAATARIVVRLWISAGDAQHIVPNEKAILLSQILKP